MNTTIPPHRCDQCKHVDAVPGTRMRCQSPVIEHSMLVAWMRDSGGPCGPEGKLWEGKHHESTQGL